jgi:hypothetical protein
VSVTTSDTDRIARQFIDRTLPVEDWTHEAHLRVGLWHLLRFSPEDALDHLRQGIRAYNVACGIVNSDTSGYHETLTRLYLALLQHFLDSQDRRMPDDELAEILVRSLGDRELPLKYYSRGRLYAVAARKRWMEPDLLPLPGSASAPWTGGDTE